MIAARWLASALLAVLFLLLATAHARIAWRVWIRRQSAPSAVPLLGGFAGVSSLLVCPVEQVNHSWFVFAPFRLISIS